jgi:hypothetical protein
VRRFSPSRRGSIVFPPAVFDLMTDPDSGLDRAFRYRAFGLNLTSNLPLPGLGESTARGLPEVDLCLGTQPTGFDQALFREVWYESEYQVSPGVPFLVIYTSREGDIGHWLRYQDGTSVFLGKQANRIWVTWPASSCLEDAATYLLGPVMAIVAQLRGSTCLHGCAVVIDGAIVGLLGPQGAGKSTSAAAFARAGYPVAADDLILLMEVQNHFVVEPSHPVVRLWPSSVRLLFGHEDALPKITPTWNKRWLNLNEDDYLFQEDPLPLGALYILGARSAADSAPSIASLSGTEALMTLLSNSWAHYVNRPTFLAAQFRVLSRLAQCTPIRHLIAHQDIRRLPDMCRIVAEDIRAIQARR